MDEAKKMGRPKGSVQTAEAKAKISAGVRAAWLAQKTKEKELALGGVQE